MSAYPTITPVFAADRRRVTFGRRGGVTTHRKEWGCAPLLYRVEFDDGSADWFSESQLADDIAIPAFTACAGNVVPFRPRPNVRLVRETAPDGTA